MITLRYLGPADEADLGPIFGKLAGTEKYIFQRRHTYKLTNADAEEILTRDWLREGPGHRFVVVDSDTPKVPQTPPLPQPPQNEQPLNKPAPPATE